MRRIIKRIFALVIVWMLLLACSAPASASDMKPTRVLTVAFPESDGINEIYEDGTYGGIVYDWLHEISKYTGWEYEFVTGDPSVLVSEMFEGKYDLMGGMFYFDGGEDILNYPKYVMGSNYSLLIYSRDNEAIKNYDYTTLNGMRIGVLRKAGSKIERLQKFLSYNKIDCELVYFDDEDGYESCLETGKADLLYGSDVYMRDNYNVAAMLESAPYYLVTAIDEPELCDELTAAMESIYSANSNFAKELYEKYFPGKYINSITFSPEELEYIQNRPTIRVAVASNHYPFIYQIDGNTKGIIPACLDLISERTGLKFELVTAESYGKQFDLLENGQADIIGCYLNRDPSADSQGVVRTAAFATSNFVVLRNKRVDMTIEGSYTMAVPYGRDLKSLTPGDRIAFYDTSKDCLKAVESGDADYTQLPSTYVEELYARDFYSNVILSADISMPEELTLALPRDEDVLLYSILNKAVNSLTEDEISGFKTKNLLMPQNRTVSLKSLIYTNPMMAVSVCVGFILLLSIVFALVLTFRMKNRVMRLKLEEAEATGRAKSDFLSRMSHEIRTPMNAIIGLTNLAILTKEATPAIHEDLMKIDSSAKFLLALLNDVLDMSKIESNKMQIQIAPFDLKKVVVQLQNMFALQMEQKKIDLQFDCSLSDQNYLGDGMRISQVLTNLLSNAYKFTNNGGSIRLSITEERQADNHASLLFRVRDTGVGIKQEDQERIFHSFEQVGAQDQRKPGSGLGLSICRSLVQLMGGELRVESRVGEGSEFYFTIQLPVYSGILEEKAAVETPCSLKGLHVLLAEDNDINAEIAKELLALQEIMVDRAEDGQQAVDLFSGHPEGYYSLILMDLNMPVKDGLSATKEIRGLDRGDARSVPILAMTANTFQEDRERAAAAGMTGFLPKPFDVEQLYEILRDAVSSPAVPFF